MFRRGHLANQAARIKPNLKHNPGDEPLTEAGNALNKHSHRESPNHVFPSPQGDNRAKNRIAQDIVEDILFDEATVFTKTQLTRRVKGRYPEIKYFVDVISDNGQGPGIRYTDQYRFFGFLEPNPKGK